MRTIMLGLFTGVLMSCGLAHASVPDGWRMVLSWSPAYCAANVGSKEPQCTEEHYFVNYGLLPFYAEGGAGKNGKSDCLDGKLSAEEIDRWLWIIPSAVRVRWLWRKHGACSGYDQAGYLALADRGARRVAIPAKFRNVTDRLEMAAADVRGAFVQNNPGLSEGAVDLICKGSKLYEVNICLDSKFQFRECEAHKECRSELRFEPIRSSRIGVQGN